MPVHTKIDINGRRTVQFLNADMKENPSHPLGSSVLVVLLLWILIHGHAGVAHAQWSNQFNLMGTDKLIKAIAKDQWGNIYIAGSFRNIGKTSANQIAKWDGSHWTDFGPSFDGSISALLCDNAGNLYVGGYFVMVGNALIPNLAKRFWRVYERFLMDFFGIF